MSGNNTVQSTDYKPLLQQAYLQLKKAEAELSAVRNKSREPIAVIGMGCRFPAAQNIEAFWEMLRQGGDAVSREPEHVGIGISCTRNTIMN